ncbi:MAG: hypothetical protein Q9174_000382 [Haloplaca sp. 1 TL-2023]
MPSLLVVVFVLQLSIHLVNTLWALYNKLPTPTSASASESERLRADVVRLKREMNATSSQDEFAKWAKLRRQHDKAVSQYEEKSASLTAFRENFTRATSILRWLGTNGLRFLLQFWFAKTPMFWIPRGWVPAYVAWLLAFPRAPTGSVSIQIWGTACATVIQLVGAAVVSGWVIAQGKEKQELKEKMGMKAEGAKGRETKKEL